MSGGWVVKAGSYHRQKLLDQLGDAFEIGRQYAAKQGRRSWAVRERLCVFSRPTSPGWAWHIRCVFGLLYVIILRPVKHPPPRGRRLHQPFSGKNPPISGNDFCFRISNRGSPAALSSAFSVRACANERLYRYPPGKFQDQMVLKNGRKTKRYSYMYTCQVTPAMRYATRQERP